MRQRRQREARRTRAAAAARTTLAAALAAAWVLGGAVLLAADASPAPTPTPTPATSPAPPPSSSPSPRAQCECSGASLNCSSRDLSAFPQGDDACASGVSRLDLSQNLLESIKNLSEWFEQDLNVLNVSHNRIQEVLSSDLKDSLQVLDVSWNQLSVLELKEARGLTVLNASQNVLSRVNSLPDACHLRLMDLSGNKLKKLSAAMDVCKELHTLNVSHNKLRTIPEGTFDQLMNEDRALLVDLRHNPLPANDSALRTLLEGATITVSAVDCSCAEITRGHANLTLCVTAMCVDDTEHWTSETHSPALSLFSTPVPNTDLTTASDFEPSASETASSSDSPSTESISSTTAVSSTIASSASPVPPKDSKSVNSTPAARAPGGQRSGGSDLVQPPPRPRPTPEPAPEPSASTAPPRESRRRRRLFVTLGLTLVVLVAAGAGGTGLYMLYRRRRRQLEEERTQRLALEPLVSSTPRFMRAADDDFVP